MQLILLLPILLLFGCKPSLPSPPLPPGASKPLPAAKPAVVQPIHTLIVSAYFGPGQATTGFFQSSTNLVNWDMAYSFPYPAQGAWIGFTNYNSAPCLFIRAGFTL